jgi:hypothetical protein
LKLAGGDGFVIHLDKLIACARHEDQRE